MKALFTVASLYGLSTLAVFLTSNILNETLFDPFVRIPIGTALVTAFLKYMYEKRRQIDLEEYDDEDIKEDGVCNGDDGGRSGS